ncbi:MAG: PQQ-binding-like beta-propeller repeat protein [Phycisphaerae bacterium]
MTKIQIAVAVVLACAAQAWAQDAWRHVWTKQLPERQPAWQWSKALPQDRNYRMVEAGDMVLVTTTGDQTLRAISRTDGSERWRFYFDGALRWAPAVSGDAVVAGSDDGTVACLALADGKLRWRYRPGPDTRQMIGHLRMQSSWPIMTHLAVEDGAVYGACGLFVDDGIWGFAVNLADGSERWIHRIGSRVSGRVLIDNGKVGFHALGNDDGTSNQVFDLRTGKRVSADGAGGKDAKALITVRARSDTPIPRLGRQTDGSYVAGAVALSLNVEAAISGGAATAVALPATWRRYGPFDVSNTLDLATMPAKGEWKSSDLTLKEEQLGITPDGTINMLAAYGEVARETGFKAPLQAEAVLAGTVKTAQAGTLVFNASADWYLQVCVDGKAIIDTLQTGNGSKPTELTAHTGSVVVDAGEHTIVLRVRPGSDSWVVRLRAGLAKDEAALAAFAGKGRAGTVGDPIKRTGTVVQALQSDDKLLLLTSDHQMHGFGKVAVGKPQEWVEPQSATLPAPALQEEILTAIGNGWSLVAGAETGQTAVDLALGANATHIVVAEPDAARVAAVRKRLTGTGMMERGRVQVIQLDATSDDLPPWEFSYVVSERPQDWTKLTRLLRPYGGTLVLPAGTDAKAIAATSKDLSATTVAGLPAVRRAGALADTSDWTHELATPGNASGLIEPRVRFPLAVGWFGGPADAVENFLVPAGGANSQEGTVMQPQSLLVVRGLWLLQGIGQITAYDQYTGRMVWQQRLPTWYAFEGISANVSTNPIANQFPVKPTEIPRAGGFNMACNETTLYMAVAKELRVYDLATGKVQGMWKLPEKFGDLRWGTVRATNGAVIATLFDPKDLSDALIGWDGNGGGYVKDRQRMRGLVCLDPVTGAVRWMTTPQRGFLNHGVALGADRVFALDLIDGSVIKGMATQKIPLPQDAAKGELVAIALADGKEIWRKPLPALLTDIVYAPERDLVLLPSRNGWQLKGDAWVPAAVAAGQVTTSKERTAEHGVLLAVRGKDGNVVYTRDTNTYFEPYSVTGKTIVQRYGAELSVETGELFARTHPVTGTPATWSVPAAGCTWLIHSLNFSANRSGWADLESGLAGNFGGIDGGCTPIHLPAGGLVNINNVSIARFGNRSKSMSRALVHRSRLTAWANDFGIDAMKAAPAWVNRVGLLPGAPGNRSVDGTWWVRMAADGTTPLIRSTKRPEPAQGDYEIAEHRYIGAAGMPGWVGAWGLVAPPTLNLPTVVPAGPMPTGDKPQFRLHVIVTEPELGVTVGKRVFDLLADGKLIAAGIDPVALAGKPRVGAVVTAEITAVGPTIALSLKAAQGSMPPVIGGILLERVNK